MALNSQAALYDWGGDVRLMLVRLQCAVLASTGAPLRDDCPRSTVRDQPTPAKPRRKLLGLF